jgi:hypothetical protein
MKTSVRRHCLRLCLGVSRKSDNIRWIGQMTVRVRHYSVSKRGVAYVKADKRVEKSRTRVRRKRGLRHGKSRSRVGKTRIDPLPKRPPDPEQVSDRSLNRHLRGMDHWQDRADAFLKRIRKSDNILDSTANPGFKYFEWKSHWSAISGRVPIAWRNHLFGPSFAYYISKNLNLKLKGGASPRRTLLDWADAIRIRNEPIRIEPNRPHLYTATCSWCREAWSSPGRSSRCPSCGRLSVAPLRRRNARRGRGLSRR